MGFFSKLAKATLKAAVSSLPPKKNNAGSKLESAAPAWKVCRYDSKTGFPKIFLSNNREWFDAEGLGRPLQVNFSYMMVILTAEMIARIAI